MRRIVARAAEYCKRPRENFWSSVGTVARRRSAPAAWGYISDLAWGGILLEQDCMPQVVAQVRKLFIHETSGPSREALHARVSLAGGWLR